MASTLAELEALIANDDTRADTVPARPARSSRQRLAATYAVARALSRFEFEPALHLLQALRARLSEAPEIRAERCPVRRPAFQDDLHGSRSRAFWRLVATRLWWSC